jgi:hypothetical protein
VLDVNTRLVAFQSQAVTLVSRTCERAAQRVEGEDAAEDGPFVEEKRLRARCSGETPREKSDDRGLAARIAPKTFVFGCARPSLGEEDAMK